MNVCRGYPNHCKDLPAASPECIAIPPTPINNIALGDSGTTTNLIRQSTSRILHNIHPNVDIVVGLPNKQTIHSTHAGDLFPAISGHSLPAYVFPDDQLQHNLLSLSSITNIGCKITLSNVEIIILLNEQVVYHGYKRPTDNLWVIDLDKFQHGFTNHSHSVNNTIQLDTDAEFVAFTHATFGSPPTSTFLHAARSGWLDLVPRLSATMISANKPTSVATAMGYLDQTRQVKKSRKNRRRPRNSPSLPPTESSSDDAFDDSTDNGESLFDVCMKLVPISDIAHVDLTGRFPVKSRKGNEYVLVSTWDNYIHYEPMPSRTSAAYIQAYTAMITFFRSVGRTPTFWRLDNETSDALVQFLESHGYGQLQPVPPGTHRANKAERAIRSAKNHFQAILATTPPSFPLELWDALLPQAEITINHLRRYDPDPLKCAYEGFHGHRYDFVAHPLAICGMNCTS